MVGPPPPPDSLSQITNHATSAQPLGEGEAGSDQWWLIVTHRAHSGNPHKGPHTNAALVVNAPRIVTP